MRADTFELEADDGVHIHVYRWLPEGEPRATLLVSHGLAEHAARYARFAEAATARGIAVYAEDHRGHGKTARTDEEVGHFADVDGFGVVVEDLARLHDRVAEDHPDLPRLLLGHSMGSTLGQHLLYRRSADFAAAAFSGTSADPGLLGVVGARVAKVERMRLGKRGKSEMLTNMAFGPFNKPFRPNRTAFDWLSRDEAEVDKYVADPRCGFTVTTQHWVDHLPAILALYKQENLRRVSRDLPLLFLVGERDPAAGGDKSSRALQRGYSEAGVKRVDLKVYPDARHEILNETNRDEVTDDLLSWLEERIAG